MIDTPLAFWLGVPIQLLLFMTLLVYWGIIPFTKKIFSYYMLFLFVPSIVITYFSIAGTMIYNVIGLSAIIIKKSTYWMNVFHLLVSIVICILMDHLATILTYIAIPSLSGNIAYIFIRLLVFLVLVAICAFLYKNIVAIIRNSSIFTNKLLILSLVLLTLLILIFMYINIFDAKRNGQSFLSIQNNLFLFMIFFIIFVILVILIMYLTIKQIRISQKEIEMENFKIYVESIESINCDMRKFRHDYLNILTSMRSFIDAKDYQGLESYFYEYILKTEKQEFENKSAFLALNKLQDNSVKGILTTKILMAQSLNIPFVVEITDKIEKINMDVIQLNRVLGILIDNAIEASTTVEDPQIRLAFIKFEDSLVMVLTNKFNNANNLKVHEIFKDGFSTKADNRGIGLGTLRNIVRTNANLNLSTKIDGDLFVQEFEIKGD